MAAKSVGMALCAAWLVGACTERPPASPEPLDLPDWEVCLNDFGGDIHQLLDAVDRGEEAAIICNLAIRYWRGDDDVKFDLLYRLYRIRGREPEGLDTMIRELDRREIAIRLSIVHMFSAELEAFDSGPRGCTVYDPVARELILRVEPGGDMECIPRRWVFWG